MFLTNYTISWLLMISHQQSGFRKDHSCHSLLIKITDYLPSCMDEGKITGLTMIDLQKAFDLVDYSTLLHTLQLYRLDTSAMRWFSSYLCDREFQVSIDNEFSSKVDMSSGVPQGSILGHLLFILCMNDFPLHLDKTQIDLYVDYATHYVGGYSVLDVKLKLNTEIQPIVHSTEVNKMTLTTTKTKAMVVETSEKFVDLTSNLSTTINGSQIETTVSEKLL